MQHRNSKNSPHNTPSLGRIVEPNKPQADARSRVVKVPDNAANDRYMPVLNADIFRQPPSFFQRLFFLNASFIMHLFIISAIIGTVFYLYPGSLVSVKSGIAKVENLINGSEVKTDVKMDLLGTVAQADVADSGREEINDILSQITSEIAAVDEQQLQQDIQNNTSIKELNRALRNQFENKPETVAMLHKEKSSQLVKSTKTKAVNKRDMSFSRQIKTQEIKRILAQYSENYRIGNTSALGQMFTDSGNERQQQLIAQLRKNYDVLFNNSKQRWIEFQDLNWVYKNDRATGTGRIKSETTLRDSIRQTTRAKIVIELQRVDDEVKIASLVLSNKRTSQASGTIITKANSVKQNVANKKILPKRNIKSSSSPSLKELNQIVSKFVWAYEGGNVVALEGLLAKNIISNDRNSRAEISKDYQELFTSSSYRQMTLRDMKWKLAKKHAKGVANMKAVVLGNNKEITTVEGKIQFVARKINNKVLITHLYHIVSDE